MPYGLGGQIGDAAKHTFLANPEMAGGARPYCPNPKNEPARTVTLGLFILLPLCIIAPILIGLSIDKSLKFEMPEDRFISDLGGQLSVIVAVMALALYLCGAFGTCFQDEFGTQCQRYLLSRAEN